MNVAFAALSAAMQFSIVAARVRRNLTAAGPPSTAR
jgi:hypothetical protein